MKKPDNTKCFVCKKPSACMIKMMGGISLPCCKSSECMNLIIKLDYEEEEKERKKQEAGYY